MAAEPKLTLPALRAMTDRGEIDTIILAAPDMQGRLQGKRVMPKFFFNSDRRLCRRLRLSPGDRHRMRAGAGLCPHLLGTGLWRFRVCPGFSTLMLAPWQPGAAIVLCDIELTGHKTADVAPRTMLKKQLARLAEHKLTAFAATELEFILFRHSYEDAWNRAYHDLTPANQYNNDYSILGTARVEPVIRKIRNAMEAAGIQVENSKGECNLGQHEINFAYREALTTADHHVIYKEAAKEIAAEAGQALTFMAKYNAREGNSCHTHLSLRMPRARRCFLMKARTVLRNSSSNSWQDC